MVKKKYKDKRERFLNVAERRTNIVLEKIRILGNCANKNLYDYRKEEMDKIFSTIERKIKEVRAKFHFPKKEKFKL